MRIGYACINMTLGEQGITTNRGMIKKTFQSKGLPYASELSLQNVRDLVEVIKWNEKHNISLYRMSSDIFPWSSEYNFDDLPDILKIKNIMSGLGNLIKQYNHRVGFHPGPFNVLASPNQDVITKTVAELNRHSEIMDMIGLPKTPFSKINIHVGGAYGNKSDALKRWVDNFHLLDETTKSRITLENDDKPNMFTVSDLMYVHEQVGIPIVFDYHHHNCHNDGMSTKEALELAISTWPKNIIPVVHVSEPRDDKNIRAHHDYVRNEVNTYGHDLDLMFESKAKELSVLEYRKNFKTLIVS
jgi:UV DNA damage endonuclease